MGSHGIPGWALWTLGPWGPIALGDPLGTLGLGDPGPWGPLGPWGPYIRTVPRAPERGRSRKVAYLGFHSLIPRFTYHIFTLFQRRFLSNGVILSTFAAVGRFSAGR